MERRGATGDHLYRLLLPGPRCEAPPPHQRM